LEEAFRQLSIAHPRWCSVHIGFDEALAHCIEACADIFIMPSRFEPCGLNQMYSQRYGTLPIVRATGGLADTVVDASLPGGSGFVFSEPYQELLLATVNRAIKTFARPRTWRKLQTNAMRKDFSWKKPAKQYNQLYKKLRPKA